MSSEQIKPSNDAVDLQRIVDKAANLDGMATLSNRLALNLKLVISILIVL